MTQPFNSPRHAIEWLTKRKVISGVEDDVLYVVPGSGGKLYMGEPPIEDKLDHRAEDMLEAYGYRFKKPKVVIPRGLRFAVPPEAVRGFAEDDMAGMVGEQVNQIRGYNGMVHVEDMAAPAPVPLDDHPF